MKNQLEFKLVNNYKCKRCGCTNYDKLLHTGMKTLDDVDSIIYKQYICRNCDFPFDINEYESKDDININPNELLQQSEFIDEGVEFQHNELNLKENVNE